MLHLNLPAYQPNIKRISGVLYIFCAVRRAFVVLTPEEWVRQHVVNYLIVYKSFPRSLIALEKEININGLKRRFDILCYNTKMSPLLLVECKATSVSISQSVYDQVFNYNHIVKAPYVAMTNGTDHHCFHIGNDGVIRMLDFPNYTEISE